MKKLIIIAIAFFAIQVSGQEKHKERTHDNDKKHERLNLSPEESAELTTKKMTLRLDLNEAQQKEINKMALENAKDRQAKMKERQQMKESGEAKKPSKEERVKMANERLDAKIAAKKRMKDILNEDQYKKWEANSEKRSSKKRREKGSKRGGDKKPMKKRR